MNKRGFTLIELLIVIAIIGILAMIAIPGYIGQQTRAARTEAYTNLENLRLLQEQHFAENGRYAPGTGITVGSSTFSGSPWSTLPGFRPGNLENLNFDYVVTSTLSGTAFSASAVGKTGRRTSGDLFTIDQNNIKNF